MVVARDGDEVAKVQLAPRFQEAIDEAAMRVGASDADAYLEGWARSAWTSREGSPAAVAQAVADELDAQFDPDTLTRILDGLNGATA